jgi:large subunit ribosomal protein L31
LALTGTGWNTDWPVPVHGATPVPPTRRPDVQENTPMKSDIHPEYVETTVTCTCGNTFTTRSTAKNGVIHADVCSNCHPFYTGKQKILDTGGRVARFESRYGKKKAQGK